MSSLELTERFIKLVQELAAASEESRRLSQKGLSAYEVDARFDALMDDVSERLLATAYEITDYPGTTAIDLRAKALVVLEYAEPDSGDIVHEAAIAIARSVVALTDGGLNQLRLTDLSEDLNPVYSPK